ncbi:dynein regulatory complex subunit 3 [Phyllopteryx taeniolatus]|uniref:dynein regulatory complex subunit 3 n=1 Tax=Phyllopteryx taeniolatus TaxID=161469 RepID=UPI002AD3A47E|nr:dynein regulatory complex subunit 3 [Phyllopteryx taeniolatus]
MSTTQETSNISGYHDKTPIYIDEEILQEAVLEQGLQDQAERIAKKEGIRFNEALRLSLEYRNIQKIDHLWEFSSLTKLNLNNNFIKKIEGLDHLVNLTWLNLSFNNIKKMEGLNGLRKLEVLNLSNNRIALIENMDSLMELTILCIANNKLHQLNNVVYLRKFKKLFTLNIDGNPIPEENNEEKYTLFLAAYFQQLKFLNNIFLNEDIRNRASAKYNLDIEEMNQGELQAQQAAEEKRRQEAILQMHEDAFVEQLNGDYLYNNIIQNDTELSKLHCLPGVDELLEAFERQLTDLCNQLFEVGLTEYKRRDAEVNLFFSRLNADVTDRQRRASEVLADFQMRHKRVGYADVRTSTSTRTAESRRCSFSSQLKNVFIIGWSVLAMSKYLNSQYDAGKKKKVSVKLEPYRQKAWKQLLYWICCRRCIWVLRSSRTVDLQEAPESEKKSKTDVCLQEIKVLCYNLMAVEFQLYSYLEETVRRFDNNISEMTASFSETAQGIYPLHVHAATRRDRTFVHCRELEDSHHQKITQIAVTTLEVVAKGEAEDDLPDDVRMLFLDKNTVMDTLAASHDNHLQTINDRETQLVTRAEAWKVALIKGIEDTELKRNRMRIADLHRYADYLRAQLKELM